MRIVKKLSAFFVGYLNNIYISATKLFGNFYKKKWKHYQKIPQCSYRQ